MNRHQRRRFDALHGGREAAPNTDEHYVERYIQGRIEQCELKDIRAGQVFRLVEPDYYGDWKFAMSDAQRMPSFKYAGTFYWRVADRPATKEEQPR